MDGGEEQRQETSQARRHAARARAVRLPGQGRGGDRAAGHVHHRAARAAIGKHRGAGLSGAVGCPGSSGPFVVSGKGRLPPMKYMLLICGEDVAETDPGSPAYAEGPLAETKEWISGFDIIECENLDEAIEVAARH